MRVQAKKMRFAALSSAVEIATIPHPGRALLDMMVLSSLNRATWDRYWLSRHGAPAQLLSYNYALLENEAWQLGAQLPLPPSSGSCAA